jgi:hypothetical protein
MRRALMVGVLALGVGSLGLDGLGQRGEAQSGFLGASPKSIQFQPINTTQNVAAPNLQNMIHTPKPPSPLGLGPLLQPPKTSLYQRNIASAPQVDPRKNPFQPNPPKSKYAINPTPPGPQSKSIWNFPFNPFRKTTTK